MAVNVLLADDHKMVREGLKQLLEIDSEIKVVGEAGDGYECLNVTNKTKPNVVLLDLNMPNLDGLQVLSIMKQQKMLCKVIVLTIHNEIEYLIRQKGIDYMYRVFEHDVHSETCWRKRVPVFMSYLYGGGKYK